MMQDCAMQILELIMNSIHADSTFIEVKIVDSSLYNTLSFTVIDDGKGMDEETCKKVTSPFSTSRNTRKVGLGVAFMKGLTEQCNGTFICESTVGKGTLICATVQKDHWDTPSIGDLGQMMMFSIQANESIDYSFTYKTDFNEFIFTTKEVRTMLDGVSLIEPSILLWIKDYINQEIQNAREKKV